MRQHGRLNKGEQPKEYGRGDRGERRIQSVRKKIVLNQKSKGRQLKENNVSFHCDSCYKCKIP